MSPDHHPRYVVREITGYACTPGRATAGNAKMSTDVWVADTWYGFRVVHSWPAPTWYGFRVVHSWPAPRVYPGRPRYPQRRASADARCAELNAEHGAWLACA